MTKTTPQDNAGAIVVFLAILFVAGRYLVVWLIKQKILFYQKLFGFSFYGMLLLLISSIGLFIYFLIKEEDFYSNFWDKSGFAWASLICFIFAILFFFTSVNAYQNGFSDEAMEDLAEAQEKLNEFNYIRDVLTGFEIQRLLIEGFDEALQEICESHPNQDCNMIAESYKATQDIFEAKQKAENIVKYVGLVKNGR